MPYDTKGLIERLHDRVWRETLRIRPKGDGWTVGFRSTGAYIECWERGGERVVELNFFDNGAHDADWLDEAHMAIEAARHWQRTGVMLGVEK